MKKNQISFLNFSENFFFFGKYFKGLPVTIEIQALFITKAEKAPVAQAI